MKHQCKYCGIERATLIGKIKHETCCPEMRQFVNHILDIATLDTSIPSLDIGTLTDELSLNIARQYKIFSKPIRLIKGLIK
jgi:hypothetical protein